MLYKKISIALLLLSVVILLYLAYKFNAVSQLKLASAEELLIYYNSAANKFWEFGFVLFILNWIWVDIVIIKTKKLYWLWIPFSLIATVALVNTHHEEELFHFKKASGLWKGGFSLSYFVCIAIILIAAFVLSINYVAFKRYFKRK